MDYKAEVHKTGRITIPIEIRKQFQIKEGDILTIRQENGELKIITAQQALAHARNLVKPYLQSKESSVANFLQWRREEGKREEQDLGNAVISASGEEA